ncbi:glycosyltransferase, partial [Escherichia coli]|nr:glycosyltransferase [Escherichia coli]
FLQAAAQLIEREDKDYKLFVIGEGSCEKEFWDLASRLNLRPYIEKRDMVSQHVLADAYSAVDVFVFPTRRASDSLGLVGLEAMSCQALLVVGDKYGPSSYAVDGWNCVCFDPFRWESLYEALSFVTSIGDERIVDAIKGRARETALEYDSAKSSGKLTRVFEDIAGER